MYTDDLFCKQFTGKDKWPVSYFWVDFQADFNTTLKTVQRELRSSTFILRINYLNGQACELQIKVKCRPVSEDLLWTLWELCG